MVIRHTTKHHLEDALKLVNEKYADNVRFNRLTRISHSKGYGETWRVTLRVKNSKAPGHRLTQVHLWRSNQHCLIAACWHVHGDFFDRLLTINPEAIIRTETGNSDRAPIYMSDNGDILNNWLEVQLGSSMSPQFLSDLCDCEV